MRIVFKALFRATTILMTLAMGAFIMVPATDEEAAKLGADNNQYMLVQMRLAKTMMTVAPEFVISRYAQATGLPRDVINDMMDAKANGQPLFMYQSEANSAQVADAPNASPATQQSNRRTEAGGALFIRPD